MTSKLVAVFLLLGIFVAANSLHIPGFIRGKPLRHHLDKLWMPEEDADNDQCATEFNFTQIVDHFDPKNTDTWNQRYQVNDKFFDKSAASPLVFFMIGGESPAEQKWVCREGYTYMELAKKYGALVIQLEHRFFGVSFPKMSNGMGDMSTESLRLLTSQQALEDMANFIQTYNAQQKWTNAKWVAFGGSYPGSLCAWFRAKYSNLTVGGICSSAPLWAKVDFYEYAEVMEFAIRNRSATNRGQSFKDCPNQIQQAFALIRQMVYTDAGRSNLTSTFKITPPLNAATSTNFEMDATNFLANIFNSFQGVIQYTYDARDNNTLNGYDLDSICKMMTDTSKDLLSRLAGVYFWTSSVESGSTVTSLGNNYTNDMLPFKRTSFNLTNEYDLDIAAEKGWMWLCCGMALGWLQTTDNSNGMFYRAISLNYYLKMCTDMFGTTINTDYVTKKVEQIQYVFPAPWNYTATNVVLPNGNYDPWHALGTYVNDTSNHQITLLTQGAAHCSDMYPQRHDGLEPLGLEATRVVIRSEVDYYINGDQVQTTSSPAVPTITPQSGGDQSSSTSTTPASGANPSTSSASVTGTTPQKSGAENKDILSFLLLFSIVTFFFLI